MLNQTGVKKETLTSPTQILASFNMQYSVGVIVDDAVQATANDGSKKIVKAGTPLKLDLTNLQTPATAGTVGAEGTANAVLLHDVDVTSGDANGTALLFGFVNFNRLDTTVQAKLTAGSVVGGVTVIAL